ncbi:endonuclease [Flavobacteriaceae bacterium R38]|nr:endonuclease [Flavobacteriaceae bacterium R38]
MKKLRYIGKIIFLMNAVFATLLLLSYILPYVFSKSFPLISILSLIVPVLIVINFIFFIYWVIRRKRQFLMSFLILLLGFQYISSFYKFSSKKENKDNIDFSILSYNVRLFNIYEWIKEDGIDTKIGDLIRKENPDILCLQEFYYEKESMFDYYPFKYIKYKTKNQKTGQAIFSKYPIITQGSLEFPDTGNNAIYADVIKGKDTVRIYNLHLESFHIDPTEESINQENSGQLLKRVKNSLVAQQEQAIIFDEHQQKSKYQKIVCGDFNNNQYSNIYKMIKGDMKDSFEEAGSGFGRTFHFKYFPIRIDFILVDENIKVVSHENFDMRYSDHYPVGASLAF